MSGRKIDKFDIQWTCKLLISGLFKGSFIPPENIQALRDLHRYEKKPAGTVASEKNRIVRVLEDANIKLSSVVSDTSEVIATYPIIWINNRSPGLRRVGSRVLS